MYSLNENSVLEIPNSSLIGIRKKESPQPPIPAVISAGSAGNTVMMGNAILGVPGIRVVGVRRRGGDRRVGMECRVRSGRLG